MVDMKDTLRDAAQARGWSLDQAATRTELFTGAGPRTVRRWFSGEGNPNVDHIPGLCKALDITPNDLFGWPESGDAAAAVVQQNIGRKMEELQALAEMAGTAAGGSTTTATRRRATAK